MSAALPLLILSVLATIILVTWLRGGAGSWSIRAKISGVVLSLLVASWLALLSFGVFHPIGSWGMGAGFIISIAAFFVPTVYNKLHSNGHT
jgi:hypothetical protein